MFNIRIPFYFGIIALIVGYSLPFLFFTHRLEDKVSAEIQQTGSFVDEGYSIERLAGYQFIKPLLSADRKHESSKYSSLKENIAIEIGKFKNEGILTSASVYVNDLTDDEWVSLNEQEQYNPASLMKVPILITFLRMEENTPGILNREVLCEKLADLGKSPRFTDKTLTPGHQYTIRQLLQYMIVYSDNQATSLLTHYIDTTAFKKTFTDMGLPMPDIYSPRNPITARNYSVFMKVLFDATYLTIKDSEFATSLLSQCSFNRGIVQGLPGNVKVAHKFGESDDTAGLFELHESGIIYLSGRPYLLTIMTKGKDMFKLPDALSDISKVVYTDMVKLNS